MKLARNLVIALALLVLLYGGLYRFVLRESVRAALIWNDPFDAAQEKSWHRLFAPALEVDLRVTFDRPRRKYLRGHWTNPETGDFVTIAGDDTFTFQLGKVRHSGKATFSRPIEKYRSEFQDGGLTRGFLFYGYDPTESGKSHDIATAEIWLQPKTLFDPEGYEATLTRAPAPAP